MLAKVGDAGGSMLEDSAEALPSDGDACAENDNADAGSFSDRCLLWRQDLIGFITKMCRNRADAEDVVQSALLRAFRAWSRFRPVGDPAQATRAWLYRIAANEFASAYRRDKVRRADGRDQDILVAVYGHDRDFVEPVCSESVSDEVSRAVAALEGPYREVIERFQAGESYSEIADAIDAPIGTVMSRLHRARAQLREELGEYAREEYGIGLASTENMVILVSGEQDVEAVTTEPVPVRVQDNDGRTGRVDRRSVRLAQLHRAVR